MIYYLSLSIQYKESKSPLSPCAPASPHTPHSNLPQPDPYLHANYHISLYLWFNALLFLSQRAICHDFLVISRIMPCFKQKNLNFGSGLCKLE